MLYDKSLMDNPFDIEEDVVKELELVLEWESEDSPEGASLVEYWDHMFNSEDEVKEYIKEAHEDHSFRMWREERLV